MWHAPDDLTCWISDYLLGFSDNWLLSSSYDLFGCPRFKASDVLADPALVPPVAADILGCYQLLKAGCQVLMAFRRMRAACRPGGVVCLFSFFLLTL